MSRFQLRFWHVSVLVFVLFVILFSELLRVVGWPFFNPDPSYSVVPDWPQLPDDVELGQVAGVDVDSEGRVFVFARAEKVWDSEPIDPSLISSPTIYIFDNQSGELLDAWGADRFVMPHGLTIDLDDNLWLTDVGLHQVYKFSPEGELLLTLGESAVSGNDETHFNRPTDVAPAPDGGFYVSDGYLNSRIIRFDSDGRYLYEWGSPGPEAGEFDVPHSIALDDMGRVYVADRSNGRIQIFDASGQFLTQWQNSLLIGRPWAVRIGDDGLVYVVDGGDQNSWLPDRARVIVMTRAGEVIGRFGSDGDQPGQFIWPHALAVGQDGAIYIAEVGGGRRVQKFVPGE